MCRNSYRFKYSNISYNYYYNRLNYSRKKKARKLTFLSQSYPFSHTLTLTQPHMHTPTLINLQIRLYQHDYITNKQHRSHLGILKATVAIYWHTLFKMASTSTSFTTDNHCFFLHINLMSEK